MNYKDILPDFIDGLLSPEEERMVHFQLSQDEELYQEYRTLKTIFKSIDNSKNSFNPSNELTQKLFTALDIKYLPNDEKNKIFKFINIQSIKYVAAAIALLFVFTIQFNSPNSILNNINSTNTFTSGSSSHNENDSETLLAESKKDIKTIKNNRYKKQFKNNNNNYKLTESNLPSESNDFSDKFNDNNEEKVNSFMQNYNLQSQLNSDEEFNQINSSKNDNDENYAYNDKLNYENNYNKLDYYSDNSNYVSAYNLQQSNSFSNNGFYNNYKMTSFSLPSNRFSLELKNTIYFNTIKTKVNTEPINVGIALFYNAFDNFSIGIDVRNEVFQKLSYQSIAPTLERAYDYNFAKNQKYNNIPFTSSEVFATTIGLALKYDGRNISKSFVPTTQLMIGTNSEGIVGRVNAGVYFKTINDIITHLGLEYSTLAYKIASSNNTTGKLGINFGISYNFK